LTAALRSVAALIVASPSAAPGFEQMSSPASTAARAFSAGVGSLAPSQYLGPHQEFQEVGGYTDAPRPPESF
jgi:hypothetical protein